MKNLFSKNIDQGVVDNLISGTYIPAKVIANTISGTGTILRGTPLTTTDGITFTASATNIRAILEHDVDTTDADESKDVAVYRSGEFNQNVVEAALSAALATATTIAAKDVEDARLVKIFLSPQYPAPVDYFSSDTAGSGGL